MSATVPDERIPFKRGILCSAVIERTAHFQKERLMAKIDAKVMQELDEQIAALTRGIETAGEDGRYAVSHPRGAVEGCAWP
jgi:hypothetical protein